jgi:hypothetical protein
VHGTAQARERPTRPVPSSRPELRSIIRSPGLFNWDQNPRTGALQTHCRLRVSRLRILLAGLELTSLGTSGRCALKPRHRLGASFFLAATDYGNSHDARRLPGPFHHGGEVAKTGVACRHRSYGAVASCPARQGRPVVASLAQPREISPAPDRCRTVFQQLRNRRLYVGGSRYEVGQIFLSLWYTA